MPIRRGTIGEPNEEKSGIHIAQASNHLY